MNAKLWIAMSLILLLSACGQKQELVIYSGRSEKFVKPVLQAFEAKTGIKTILHKGSATALLDRLNIEKERTPADIYISNDAGTLQRGSQWGLFLPLDAAMVQAIAEKYRAPDNSWVGLSGRARVLVVNTKKADTDWIKSVKDLADPRLKGQIGITTATNESFIAGASVYQHLWDEEQLTQWLTGLKNNADRAFPKHSAVVKAVADGDKTVGLVNHYYIFRHLDKNPNANIQIRFPDQDSIGVAWNVAGVAIPKHGKNIDKAKKFVEFLISEQGQKIFAQVNREYPTRTAVATAPNIPAPDSFKVSTAPMNIIGQLRTKTVDLINKSGLR